MKHTLVGYTGFVGGNLAAQHRFDNLYNSKNIADAFGADNGLVVYSGMPSEKFLANADPARDLAAAENAMENMRKMKPEQLVLISTVDVYPKPRGVFEDTDVDAANAPAYGKNRLALEGWVREEYPDALVVRLPGLFGPGLKKNFIFDLLHAAPSMLTEEAYRRESAKEPLVAESYVPDRPGFYRLAAERAKRQQLEDYFRANDFNALHFTDSRAVFQFYNLANLWHDLERCMRKGMRTVNFATEPVEAGALYHFLTGEEFENHLDRPPARYDMKTRYGREFGGLDDYIEDRTSVVGGIAKFVTESMAEGR